LLLESLPHSAFIPRHTVAQGHVVIDKIADATLADGHVEVTDQSLVDPRNRELLPDVLVASPQHDVPAELVSLQHQTAHFWWPVP